MTSLDHVSAKINDDDDDHNDNDDDKKNSLHVAKYGSLHALKCAGRIVSSYSQNICLSTLKVQAERLSSAFKSSLIPSAETGHKRTVKNWEQRG